MADLRKRLSGNVDGEFYVDSTCIDCDACRQLAPASFGELGDYSYVHTQPRTAGERRAAIRALLACPTGSIGMTQKSETRAVMNDFPMLLDDDGVYYCGFNSPLSFGGNSYFLLHPDGNWLIDSPRYLPHLVQQFETLGGIRYIFLTHRDDVADTGRYADHFRARRLIHRDELSAQPGAEIVIEGVQPVRVFPEFLVLPTPGHTRGHCALLMRDKYLFTGDHLWWSRNTKHLSASEDVCWYDCSEQVKSMRLLLDYSFEWVLPGHGEHIHLSPAVMHEELRLLVESMRASSHVDRW